MVTRREWALLVPLFACMALSLPAPKHGPFAPKSSIAKLRLAIEDRGGQCSPTEIRPAGGPGRNSRSLQIRLGRAWPLATPWSSVDGVGQPRQRHSLLVPSTARPLAT